MSDWKDSELSRLLKPWVSRVRRQIWLNRFGICVCAGVGCGIVVLLLSFATPIRHAPAVAAAVTAAVCLIAGVVLAMLKQRPMQLAVEIDRHGFQERVQTLLMLQNSDNTFSRLQREDTIRALQSADPKEIPVRWPRKPYVIAGIGLAVACILAVIPGPQAEILREQAEIDQVLRSQVERVELGMDLLEKNTTLSDVQKAELNDRLQELAKELRSGRDYKESIRQISQMQQQLGEAKNRQNQKELSSLRDLLADQSATADLADRLEEQPAQQAVEEIRQAVQQALQEEEGDSGAMAQALREAAQGMEHEAWQTALANLADAMEQGDEAAVEAAMRALEQAMGGDSGLDRIDEQLQAAKSQISRFSQDDAAGGDSSQGDSDEGSQNGQGEQDGQQGDGDGSSQGDGEGDQGQGSGGGTGQTDGDGSDPGGNSVGAGSGDLVDSERVYVGDRLDAEGGTERLQGEMDTQGPRQQMETGPGSGTLDGYIPYQEAAGEYAQDAINAAKREELPPAVQEWVEAYFTALQNS